MLGRTFQRFSAAAELLRPASFFKTLARVHQLADTTRELAVVVEDLRIRTEQLALIQQSEWTHREELDRLPSVLDRDRIAAHVARAVDEEVLHDDPFPHAVIERWLPRDVYDAIVKAVPPAVFFADRDPGRQRLMVPFPFAPNYSQRVWRFVADEIAGRIVHDTVSRKFEPVIREYVGAICPALPRDLDLTLHPSDGRIMLRRPGYVITPHRDPKWGFLTCLMYLARDGDNEAYGTQLYRVRDDEEAPSGKPFYIDPERCELVKSVPNRANTLLVFLNSRGAHGASIPADAQPPDMERFVYQFRLGPANDTIRRLLKCMPEEQRKMWAGAKADKAITT